MKQTVLCITFAFFCLNMNAQEWLPMGASWYYTQPDFSLPGNRYLRMEVIGDTILNGKYCRIIDNRCNCTPNHTGKYFHVDNDRVFTYNEDLDQFDLIYDFTLSAGDTLWYHDSQLDDEVEEIDTTYYVIDSISSLNIGGTTLKVQHIRTILGWSEFGWRLFEYIGSDQCFTPQAGYCDPVTTGIRCYEDSILGFIKLVPDTIDCDEIITSVTTIEPERIQISVYPNPSSGFCHIDTNSPVEDIHAISLQTGTREVMNLDQHGAFKYSVEFIDPGVYVLDVLFDDKSRAFQKLIVY